MKPAVTGAGMPSPAPIPISAIPTVPLVLHELPVERETTEQIRRLADKYIRIAEKYGKRVGIHAHNNQQLAFANTIEACTIGVSYLDVTMSGMGRGAGNCYTELLMGFLRNPKYRISPVLKFIENHMVPLKKAGVVWGCDVQYMITGNANQHPRTAIAFTGEGRTDYDNFYTQITSYE